MKLKIAQVDNIGLRYAFFIEGDRCLTIEYKEKPTDKKLRKDLVAHVLEQVKTAPIEFSNYI